MNSAAYPTGIPAKVASIVFGALTLGLLIFLLMHQHEYRETAARLRQTLDMAEIPVSIAHQLLDWAPIVVLLGTFGYAVLMCLARNDWSKTLFHGLILTLIVAFATTIPNQITKPSLPAQEFLLTHYTTAFAELPLDVTVKEHLMAEIKMTDSVSKCKRMDKLISDMQSTYGGSFSQYAEALDTTEGLCTTTVYLHKMFAK